MAFHMRDTKTHRLVRELAIQHQWESDRKTALIPARLAALRAGVLRQPPTGLNADKGYFDDLAGGI